ncbi:MULTISPECIES: hypothetical protein [Paenibacillus]|uniref:Uncharacterized protein n=1 Tax=Paenibacillus albilobatus TaxID=2716884 RepID=A0A920CE90_9BACL|nr:MULTISPECIES: hypothetical protein [Paenibacillus]GIO34603.1 hypothetical protein J2TS6_57440 [Paenibacillus albilobatus]
MDINIKNYYCLIAGVLAILFAVTHAWNGQSVVLPTLLVNDIALNTRITFTYIWHIITAENLAFGIVFIILSFQSEISKIRFAAWIFVSLLLIRLMVILGVTALYDASALTNTLIDSIAVLIYSAFIILGTRIKKKEE